MSPLQTTLELRPTGRLDVIDVSRRLADGDGDDLLRYPRGFYVSYHTTAGYLDPALCARLGYSQVRLRSFLGAYRRVFPPDAGYHHDRLDLRSELSDEQRKREPRNADSHLTFIGAGLTNCATYEQRPDRPVWFVDLDGTNGDRRRRRRTTVVGYSHEEEVAALDLAVPVSSGSSIDSVSLLDPRHGFLDRLRELLTRHGVTTGRIDVSLEEAERDAGLTVNEFETLLMKHDLAEVLADPLRYMAEGGRRLLRNPGAIPGRTIDYAKYDAVQVLNELLRALGMKESLIERIVHRILAVPAARFLRMKRSVSLPVLQETDGRGAVVHGTYQSPILIQWRRAEGGVRRVSVRVLRFS